MSYITKCADCGVELRLLKDSTEGMKCYCGKCWTIAQCKDEQGGAG